MWKTRFPENDPQMVLLFFHIELFVYRRVDHIKIPSKLGEIQLRSTPSLANA